MKNHEINTQQKKLSLNYHRRSTAPTSINEMGKSSLDPTYYRKLANQIDQLKKEIEMKQTKLEEMLNEMNERFDFQARTMKFTTGLVMINNNLRRTCGVCKRNKPWTSRKQFNIHKMRCKRKQYRKNDPKKNKRQI